MGVQWACLLPCPELTCVNTEPPPQPRPRHPTPMQTPSCLPSFVQLTPGLSSLTLATMSLASVPVVLSFRECYLNGIIESVAF